MTPRMVAIAIAKEEAARAGIDIDALLGESRRPEHVRPRHRTWAVTKWTLGIGWKELGRLFDVDHSTIKVAVDRYQRRLNAEHGMAPATPDTKLRCA